MSHSATGDSKYSWDRHLIGSQWIMLHGEAKAFEMSGEGTSFSIPQGLSTRILNARIFVLVLDSIVDDVAMIVDTLDNLRQQFFSLFLRCRLIETLSRQSIEKL